MHEKIILSSWSSYAFPCTCQQFQIIHVVLPLQKWIMNNNLLSLYMKHQQKNHSYKTVEEVHTTVLIKYYTTDIQNPVPCDKVLNSYQARNHKKQVYSLQSAFYRLLFENKLNESRANVFSSKP